MTMAVRKSWMLTFMIVSCSFIRLSNAQAAAWPATSYSPYFQNLFAQAQAPVAAIPSGPGAQAPAIPIPAAAPPFPGPRPVFGAAPAYGRRCGDVRDAVRIHEFILRITWARGLSEARMNSKNVSFLTNLAMVLPLLIFIVALSTAYPTPPPLVTPSEAEPMAPPSLPFAITKAVPSLEDITSIRVLQRPHISDTSTAPAF